MTTEQFIALFSAIITNVVTGVITFLITKYNSKNNKPLDKMEISYNTVYYPIYLWISLNGKRKKDLIFYQEFWKEIDSIVNSNRKFSSATTVQLTVRFGELISNNDSIHVLKYQYNRLISNIRDYQYKIRKDLNYPTQSFFEGLSNLSIKEKFVFITLIGTLLVNIACMIVIVFPQYINQFPVFMVCIVVVIILMWLIYFVATLMKKIVGLLVDFFPLCHKKLNVLFEICKNRIKKHGKNN